MTESTGRTLFAGHAIGAAARFHRLDEAENLNHIVPTLGASVLPATGGRSQSHVDPFCFAVDQPRPRTLLAVERVDSLVEGRDPAGRHETELTVEVEKLNVLDKLYVDFLRLHMCATRTNGGDAVISTQGNRLDGLRLGKVEVRLTIDDEPLCACSTGDALAGYYRSRDEQYRQQNYLRFGAEFGATDLKRYGEHYRFSLVRQIELVGPEEAQQAISVDGYTIHWKGFGRIILGEVHVKGHERRVTMLRLAMGSDAAGTGSAGDGQSNGTAGG